MGFLFCPLLTAEAFAQASGLPLGVVEAQLDRRILPVVRLGKRRMVNLEALRQIAQQSEPAARPQPREDGPQARMRKASKRMTTPSVTTGRNAMAAGGAK